MKIVDTLNKRKDFDTSEGASPAGVNSPVEDNHVSLPADDYSIFDNQADDVEDSQATYDDEWLNELTPIDVPDDGGKQNEPPANVAPPPVINDMDLLERRKQELLDSYRGLEHVDAEVAEELYSKLIDPTVDKLRKEIADLRRMQEHERKAKESKVISDVNKKLVAKYPNVEKILRSKQFIDYINSTGNPYASETEYDTFCRAYFAGDDKYVLAKIDSFVGSKGKPKPPVSAEPQRGSGQGAGRNPKRAMTAEEFQRRRMAIKRARRGTYPPGAMRQLVNEYLESNKRG